MWVGCHCHFHFHFHVGGSCDSLLGLKFSFWGVLLVKVESRIGIGKENWPGGRNVNEKYDQGVVVVNLCVVVVKKFKTVSIRRLMSSCGSWSPFARMKTTWCTTHQWKFAFLKLIQAILLGPRSNYHPMLLRWHLAFGEGVMCNKK